MTKLMEMIEEVNKTQKKQHNALFQEMKEGKENLASQMKVIDDLQHSLTYFRLNNSGNEVDDVLDENTSIKKEMANIHLVNEKLTKKIAEVKKTGKAYDIELNKVKS